jgi:hypothetical protein
MNAFDFNIDPRSVKVMLYTESRWQRFQRKVLRRKTVWWAKPKGAYTNTSEITWPSASSGTVTHMWLTLPDGTTVNIPLDSPRKHRADCSLAQFDTSDTEVAMCTECDRLDAEEARDD